MIAAGGRTPHLRRRRRGSRRSRLGGSSRRRDGHSAAPPSHFNNMLFNMDAEGVSAKMTVSPTARRKSNSQLPSLHGYWLWDWRDGYEPMTKVDAAAGLVYGVCCHTALHPTRRAVHEFKPLRILATTCTHVEMRMKSPSALLRWQPTSWRE